MSANSTIHIVFSNFSGHSVDIRTRYEFFTDKEEPENRIFTDIVDAINTCALYLFVCASDLRQIEMENVTYILSKKSEPHSAEDVESTKVPLEFTFSNVPAVTIECPITGVGVHDIAGFAERTIGKCKTIGKTLTFSNGQETIVVNRRFLTSVHVKR